MTNNNTARPAPGTVAARAVEILAAICADPEYRAFEAATLEYSDDWQCFTGFPVISRWNLEADAPALLVEGLRALAVKAAVYEMTGDEHAAEVPVAVPVDEMTHAMIAQPQLLARIAGRIGVSVIHQTDQECTAYEPGDYTHQVYTAAWGDPHPRFWLGRTETDRRVKILSARYQSIGLERSGREHSIDFATTA
ncbi:MULTISPECIES: hypothetical protein [unclassified Streptomyces]|uniref:hypothetical protein n=1 Tax=unclassified Streptomyces TaxID=2593676 RepID=UPI000CD541B6|nr:MULTISPECIES: hypothetical protein [unclassified Streptomyces]